MKLRLETVALALALIAKEVQLSIQRCVWTIALQLFHFLLYINTDVMKSSLSQLFTLLDAAHFAVNKATCNVHRLKSAQLCAFIVQFIYAPCSCLLFLHTY